MMATKGAIFLVGELFLVPQRPEKLSCHAKVTAHLAIGLFSDYIREGI
jgi:hypothetical protein